MGLNSDKTSKVFFALILSRQQRNIIDLSRHKRARNVHMKVACAVYHVVCTVRPDLKNVGSDNVRED